MLVRDDSKLFRPKTLNYYPGGVFLFLEGQVLVFTHLGRPQNHRPHSLWVDTRRVGVSITDVG